MTLTTVKQKLIILLLLQVSVLQSLGLSSSNLQNTASGLNPLHAFRVSSLHALSVEYALEYPQEIIVIPLKRAGNLILLDAIVDNQQGNLILDSGSSSFVLNSIYFGRGHRSTVAGAGGVTGGVTHAGKTRIRDLELPGIRFSRINAHLADLGHIEQARGVKVLGFFGLGLLRDFEMVIDLVSGVLELRSISTRGLNYFRGITPHNYDLVIPVRIESDVVFFDAHINRRRLSFCLDTGAETNVLSSNLPSAVLNTVEILSRSNLRGAGNQVVEVLHGNITDFSIGEFFLPGMSTLITNLRAMSGYYGVNIDGMLGSDFLEKGVFTLNMRSKELGIVFNKAQDE